MKKIYLIAFMTLFFLTGCDEAALSELKTRNEELRIENVSLKAQVNDLERNIKECNKKYDDHLGTFDPSKIDLNDNPIR